MTVDLMHISTLDDLSRLSPLTKRELLKYARNQTQVVIGNADLITGGKLSEAEILSAAHAFAEAGRKYPWQQELEGLLAERAEEAR